METIDATELQTRYLPALGYVAAVGHPVVALKHGRTALTLRIVVRSGTTYSQYEQPLLGGGGTVASSLLAGNVFVATANPATLMTIGNGVGAAVMGPTGIVAQAPFVAAGSALIPVVAPVMAFMTLSSMLTKAGLNRVEKALNGLSKDVNRAKDLMHAGDYGRLRSAAETLQEVRSQLEHTHVHGRHDHRPDHGQNNHPRPSPQVRTPGHEGGAFRERLPRRHVRHQSDGCVEPP